MAITVYIPTPLRRFAAGQQSIDATGSTVGELLDNVAAAHPELVSRVRDDSGRVRRFVHIFANDMEIRRLDSLETTLSAGDEVSIRPAMAGV